jgi:lipoate-protein ligase A
MLISFPNAFGTAAQNMAVDATLLETLPAERALFRHYGWTEPSITIGYTQKHASVAHIVDLECTICRRITGGGIVDHRNDWTYSLIFGHKLPPQQLTANELYAQVHSCIQSALAAQAVATHAAPCPRSCSTASPALPSDECFKAPVQHDLLNPEKQKIAGAAIKRTRQGLLIQGSIDRAKLPLQFDDRQFSKQLVDALTKHFELTPLPLEDYRPLLPTERVAELRQQFSSEQWTHKR